MRRNEYSNVKKRKNKGKEGKKGEKEERGREGGNAIAQKREVAQQFSNDCERIGPS